MNRRKRKRIAELLIRDGGQEKTKLFSEDQGHKHYLSIKNKVHFFDVRQYCCKLYRQFQDFCPDKAFSKKFAQSPVSHWWEMRLFDLFKKNSFALRKTKSTGPDICFSHNGQMIWCEAIAPAAREAVAPVIVNSPEDVPEVFHDISYGEEEGLILKITGAFKEKSEKIRKYAADGVIPSDEPVIIAINSSNVPDANFMEDYNVPIVAQALFGIDRQTISIPVFDGTGARVIDGQPTVVYPERRAVKKNENVLIPTTAFLGKEHEHISAVIYSSKRLFDMPKDNKGIIVLINPLARNKINHSIFDFALTYYADGNVLKLNKYARKRCRKFNGI